MVPVVFVKTHTSGSEINQTITSICSFFHIHIFFIFLFYFAVLCVLHPHRTFNLALNEGHFWVFLNACSETERSTLLYLYQFQMW